MGVETEPVRGDRIGHYVVEGKLGEGGMGVVYRAEDARHERKVAIKVVRPDRLAEPHVAERFRREGNNQAYVSHPNILPLLDSGAWGELAYFVTPYQPEGDLSTLLGNGRTLLPRQVLRVVRQIADALSAAHRAGIVHRDVKPRNILIAHLDDLSCFLTDFGLSHRVDDTRLTEVGRAHGTVAYMAPEQFHDGPLTTATDIYALAVTTHEMAIGPFRCDESDPACPVEFATLCAVIRKATARDPAQRHTAASDFAAAVEAAIRGSAEPVEDTGAPSRVGPGGSSDSVDIGLSSESLVDVPASPVAASAGPPPTDRPTSPEDPPPGRRAPRRLAYALAAVLLVTTAVVVTMTVVSSGSSPAQTSAAPQATSTPESPATTAPPIAGTTQPASPRATTARPRTSAPPPTSTPTTAVAAPPATTDPVPVPVPIAQPAPVPAAPAAPAAPAGSQDLSVCANTLSLRDRPGAVADGARILGTMYKGATFLTYPGPDGWWVEGYSSDLAAQGWVERVNLGSSCPS
jgi:serine/threonine protein kinase